MSWADSFSRALFLTPFTERGVPCSPLNSRSFRFQTHGRKGQGAEGCGQGPGWVQILEPNREKHLNNIRKKTCAHASCKTCSAPASPPRRPNRKILGLLSCSSGRHRPPRRCLGASCHCPQPASGRKRGVGREEKEAAGKISPTSPRPSICANLIHG